MSCKGCPGTQEQVGDEQADLKRRYEMQKKRQKRALAMTAKLGLCRRCRMRSDRWRCDRLPDEAAYRQAVRKGHCPEGVW